jgi:ATP-dependent Clp protease ATP-binding subunit ClpC
MKLVSFVRSLVSGQPGRFDTFNDDGRKVLTFAQTEAQRFRHNYIGTEHLLLGLLRVPGSVGVRVLVNMNVDLPTLQTATESSMEGADADIPTGFGLTPAAKRVIELAIDEARRLGHSYIGTEHLLLGLVREGDSIAAGVLRNVGANLNRVRVEVVAELKRNAG